MCVRKDEEILYFGKNQHFINCVKNLYSPVIKSFNSISHLNEFKYGSVHVNFFKFYSFFICLNIR